ncbi:MAG: lamin tail domain-containing protein, partial [Planctomycetales bacterium]|nr:lamin tail domain-containing protein [Planctomycetales bacterium]
MKRTLRRLQRTARLNRASSCESLESRIVLDSTLVFNEVMYHPSDADEGTEFIEFHNQMAVDLDISNWRIADGVEFEFPVGTIVPGGSQLVVARDPEVIKARLGIDAMGPFAGRLSNRGERLELRDRSNRLMDVLEYDDGGKWDVAADGHGPSLSKIDKDAFTGRPDNWTHSFISGGTPGAVNFEDTSDTPPTVRSILADDSVWSWNAASVPGNWATSGFDDDAWAQGSGPFYAGDARIAGNEPIVVENVAATASSFLASHDPVYAVDGSGLNEDGSHVNGPSTRTMWLSSGNLFAAVPDVDPEITFDLGSEQLVGAMRVWNLNSVESAICCLGRGIAKADILVAGDDGVFTTLIEDQPFDIAPGTETDFSQLVDLGGVKARFVKIDVDTSNGIANHGDGFGFVGLSEVQFQTFEPAGTTEVSLGTTSHYFRHSFSFSDSPERTSIELDMLLDDSAVVYINGTEVYRHNLPAGPINAGTLALFEQKHAARTDKISIPGDVLNRGTNVIAVEVHQAAANDADMVFAMNLQTTTQPPEPFLPESVHLQINEAAAASAAFFVELHNDGAEAIDLSGTQIQIGDNSHAIPAGTMLVADGLYVMNGLSATDGQRVSITNADGSFVYDVVEVGDRGFGLTDDGETAFVNSATPGTKNDFAFINDIVINEIMYNYRPTVARPPSPAVLEVNELVGFDAVWRYNDTGEDLAPDWYLTSHDVGGNWSSGPGLLGFETSTLPGPGLQTETADSRNTGAITYYFETEFTLTPEQFADFDGYQMRHIVDDAALVYLNGVEVLRFNLPEGAIDSETRSEASVRNGELSDLTPIPKGRFVAGVNRLAVEVHQQTPTSNDLAFGLEVRGGPVVVPADPGTPYSDNDEEWIELFNRGSSTVSLAGWSLDDAIDYDFPPEQTIAPNEYLLVARDAQQLREKYPHLSNKIIGEFSGTLSNQNDRIVLKDQHKNVADVVEYFEDGQWPGAADGRGSSLKLRDPFADNSRGLAWDASDELPDSEWKEYSYTGVTQASPVGADGAWRELVIGMLADGIILLDDVEIIKDPSGEAVNVLQNGTFEGDQVGAHPDKWRLIGNHRQSEVVVDPSDPNNKVLKFVAMGATEHMHNHGETTLMENGEAHRIDNGVEYEIRFKARWVSGSNQFNTRLYFNRLARTTPIDRPDHHGTPGERNSQAVTNMGPTYEGLIHSPTVPSPQQAVTVSVTANDADGMQNLMLMYRVSEGAWESTTMQASGDRFSGVIPGQDEATIVQFYVEGTDASGNKTQFPRRGQDSRALYKVQDGLAADTGLHNLRMVLSPEDAELLHDRVEVMSNDPIGLTIIYDESTVFYDANIRLSGSQRARPIVQRLSFKVSFNSDHLFRGVHNGITLDRSESTGFGQREHLYHQGMTRSGGGLPSEYNDLFNIITPQSAHTGGAEAQFARYSDLFLDEQYENGSAGQVYEYELVYYP